MVVANCYAPIKFITMTEKLKILIIAACPFPEYRGTPTRIKIISEALYNEGHEVYIATYNIGNNIKTYATKIFRWKNKIYFKKTKAGPGLYKFFWEDPKLFLTLLHIIKKNKFDIIHSFHFEGMILGYLISKLTKTKIIFDFHTTLIDELPDYKLPMPAITIKFISKIFDEIFPKKSDYIITASKNLYKFLINKNIPEKKIKYIPISIDVDYINQIKPFDVKKYFNIEPAKAIIYAGNLSEFQNIDILIKAFYELTKKYDNYKLLFVGETSFEQYKKMIKFYGIEKNIVFIERKSFEEVIAILKSIPIAVIPRLNCPGLPQKIINYMASGNAIICFKGIAEFLTHLETGYIVEKKSVDGLKSGILFLLENPDIVKELGENAKILCKKLFDKKNMIKSLEEVYSLALREIV